MSKKSNISHHYSGHFTGSFLARYKSFNGLAPKYWFIDFVTCIDFMFPHVFIFYLFLLIIKQHWVYVEQCWETLNLKIRNVPFTLLIFLVHFIPVVKASTEKTKTNDWNHSSATFSLCFSWFTGLLCCAAAFLQLQYSDESIAFVETMAVWSMLSTELTAD